MQRMIGNIVGHCDSLMKIPCAQEQEGCIFRQKVVADTSDLTTFIDLYG